MTECYICGKKDSEKKGAILPKKPIVDKEGNIKGLVKEDFVPICKSKDSFDIDPSYFTNRIYSDGRKRITWKLLAPLLNKEDVEKDEALEIVKKWLKKNYEEHPPNQDEKIYQILSWAKSVVNWAYRNDADPYYGVLKGLNYEVDTSD